MHLLSALSGSGMPNAFRWCLNGLGIWWHAVLDVLLLQFLNLDSTKSWPHTTKYIVLVAKDVLMASHGSWCIGREDTGNGSIK